MGSAHSTPAGDSSSQSYLTSQAQEADWKPDLSCNPLGHLFSLTSTPSGDATVTPYNEPKRSASPVRQQPEPKVPTPFPAAPNADLDYTKFLRQYPEYKLTWLLDALRQTEYKRLDQVGEAYVDYMGGSLYPESLVARHANFLSQNTLGNTHSINNSSSISSRYADGARKAVLSFFQAPSDYTVIFTANASAALKLVGEAYPFRPGNSFVLGSDSHNSVHGIRQYAFRQGAKVRYIESTNTGGVDVVQAKATLLDNRPSSAPSLFALTGQSNISNAKCPLSLMDYASKLGYDTLLDAAALAPTSVISLTETPVDAMAISFYKMFGYPTGVGALVAKKSFLAKLRRPWFAGGTVDVVQVPGYVLTMAHDIHEQFEDGTINYLSLPAIADGLRFLTPFLPYLPLRLSTLFHHLTTNLIALKHPSTGLPAVRILSRLPSRRLHHKGEQLDTGTVLSCLFLSPSGEMIPNSFIEFAASARAISLRTGCMCNPGGAAALLGLQPLMAQLSEQPQGVRLAQFEAMAGHELGVVRVSLGLGSDFKDVQRVIRFAESIVDEAAFNEMWKAWLEHQEAEQAH